MIKAFLKAFALVVSIFFLILPGASLAEDKEVTVTGKAPITGSKNQAQKEALKEAFRSAVEKGIGVWIKSETEVKNAMTVKDQILAKAEGYVKDHEVIKEGEDAGQYFVTIRAKVSVDQIGADFAKLLGRVQAQIDRPSISFVLTTWKIRGTSRSTAITQIKTDTSQSFSLEKINEDLFKKEPNSNILESFGQEFNDKGFDPKVTDNARAIALSESSAQTSINPNDRAAVRKAAEKEGANYVARGEVKILGVEQSSNNTRLEVAVEINVEIIDVGSGDQVAAYTTTVKAADSNVRVAEAQAIKKAAVLAARTMADQTLKKWQARALSGRSFSIEIRNIKSARSQRAPLISTISSLATIRSQTSPQSNVLGLDVFYQGSKGELGDAILKAIEKKPGFSLDEFDGPDDEEGKIIFKFLK